jgi:hypothetical protein
MKDRSYNLANRTMKLLRALALIVLIGGPRLAVAQMFSYEPDRRGPVQALGIELNFIDFSYAGTSDGVVRFDFAEPAIGIRYSRPSVDIWLAYGRQGADQGDRRLIEAAILAWNGFLLTPRNETRIYLPLVLHSGYRAVGTNLGTDTAAELFNFTTLALGTGLIVERRLGSRVQLDARALPMLGLALRSFEGFAGDTRLFDGRIELHFMRLFGRYGLTTGYQFRVHEWDVDATRFLQQVPQDAFDYRSRQHALRLGVNW